MTGSKPALSRASRIAALLEQRFSPAEIAIEDQSARHAGHAGASAAGETHFAVRIISPAFAAMSRVARHRAVTDALAAEFAGGLHALTLDLKAPEELPSR